MTDVSELGDALKRKFHEVRSGKGMAVSPELVQSELAILDVGLEALEVTLAASDDNVRARTILTGIDAVRTALRRNHDELDLTFYQCGASLLSAGIKSTRLDEALESIAGSLSSDAKQKACDRANGLRREVISRGDDQKILWLAVRKMINGQDHYDAVWDAAQATFEIARLHRVWEAETKAFETQKSYGRVFKDGSSVLATPHSVSVRFANGGSVTMIGGKIQVL